MTPESLLTMPIPRDIPLGMPAYPILLELALVLLFLLHILFVNLMLGGSILAFVFEIMGRKRPDYDRLAREIVSTITVNKSMAVVLGVGPLLTINVLYTLHFYTANAITGRAWIMVVPLVAIAFLLGYVHKYTWDRYAQRKELHLAIGASSTFLLLIVPLIFLSNINLMLFPEKWKEVDGWLASLLIPNVFPRYLHFLMACLALTGLFLTGYFGRSRYPAEEKFETLKVSDLRKIFLSITLGATVAQLVVGPLVFFTLPSQGVTWLLIAVICIGLVLALTASAILWIELILPKKTFGVRFYVVIGLLTCTVIFMGYGRHTYREAALVEHKGQVAAQTQVYQSMLNITRWRASQGLGVAGEDENMPLGQKIFKRVCSTCHALDKRLVGPPLTEIVDIYGDDTAGIIKWVKAPGKKRPDFPEMPAIKLTEEQYNAVAQYLLDAVAAAGESQESDSEAEAEAGTEASGQP